MERASTHDPTIGSLLKGILTDVQTLIREEIALARVEITEQVVNARTAAIEFAGAAGALGCAVAFLLIALALGIADLFMWPTWAGFFVVGIGLGLISLFAYLAARRRLYAVSMVPEETVTSLKENSAWIAKRLSSEPR
jgi:hypothetical protein